MENAEENDLENERLKMKCIERCYVDPDYIDDEWGCVNDYCEYCYVLYALIKMS